MSAPPVTPSHSDAIVAATHELKRRRVVGHAAKAAAPAKGKGFKTVRCRLRITKSEDKELSRLKKQLARKGIAARKDELIRAGLLLLVHLDPTNLRVAIRDVIAPEPATSENE